MLTFIGPISKFEWIRFWRPTSKKHPFRYEALGAVVAGLRSAVIPEAAKMAMMLK